MDISEDYNDILQACVVSNKKYVAQYISCDSEVNCYKIRNSLKTQMKQFCSLEIIIFYKNEN